ncbi:hypothetical protein P389DRAFT_16908 [Cystobasidium minutum MCA 4210]|uniref:uncharacterized protein n=1 Tax=Cystobasidium minutum MCA 4210 TaxID=1397322 RepID=UPI0034CF8782|eukprot:jgi/Rhomi1/16908/CE16907_459
MLHSPCLAAGQRGFEWKKEYDTIIDVIATTNQVNTPWPELRKMLMYKIAENLSVLPTRSANVQTTIGPHPASSASEDATMDTSNSNNHNNSSQRKDEDAQSEKEDLQQQVWDALDSFETEPPFTIQRLAELTSDPTKNYTSALKYLRAIQRTLQVSSGQSAYVADTFALSPGAGETSILGHASTISSASTSPLLRYSSSSSPFNPATTAPGGARTPLLSPIPWITNSSSFEDSSEGDGEMHLEPSTSSSSPHNAPANGHDSSLAEGGSPSLPAISPTGGRVDELDPLPPSQTSPQATGMADHPEPITDPQGSPPRNSKSPDLAGSPPHGTHGRRPSF